ncbi:MAG TPA: hypothetical protein VN721_09825 [Flavipsychrobacter sp.]|nr:hypothetical protein [Flavipsychrobacter sp.]
MKIQTYLVAILLLACTISCKKIKKLATINVNIPYSGVLGLPDLSHDTLINFDSFPHGISVSLPPYGMPTYSQQFLSQYNTSPSKVNSAKLQSYTMQILKPVGGYFDFIDTVQIYLSAPNQPEVLVAYNNNVPHDQNTVTMTSTYTELKNYFLQDSMFIRVYANFIKKPAGDSILMSTNFNVQADPLN